MSAGLPKGGYGIIGRAAMRSDKICKEAKAVYALLCSYTGSKHYCYPTVETLATDLQTSERTIIRLTEELQAHGFCKKVKVANNKRKTAYIPLHPYGAIGDTDDTILEGIGDTDDTINGDTHGTLILTVNNNSSSGGGWSLAGKGLKPTNTTKEPKVKKARDFSSIEPVLNILRQYDAKIEKAISRNLQQIIQHEIEENGVEFVCDAVRGRLYTVKSTGKPLALTTFFDPDRAEWRADMAREGVRLRLALEGLKMASQPISQPVIEYSEGEYIENPWQTSNT